MKSIETRMLFIIVAVVSIVFATTITSEVKAEEDPLNGFMLVQYDWEDYGWCCTCRPFEGKICDINAQCCKYIPSGQPGGCPTGPLPCPPPPVGGGGGGED